MYVDVQLRVPEIGDILPKFEWQVVRLGRASIDADCVVFRSDSRPKCLDYLTNSTSSSYDYKLQAAEVYSRPRLSTHVEAAMSLVVAKHGRDQKISCIKEVRAIYGLGLKEAKELVEDYIESL